MKKTHYTKKVWTRQDSYKWAEHVETLEKSSPDSRKRVEAHEASKEINYAKKYGSFSEHIKPNAAVKAQYERHNPKKDTALNACKSILASLKKQQQAIAIAMV